MLCDPDYINRKLIGYIDYRQRLSEDTKRTYTYAATYEDFIKLIDRCNDIEHLKQIRYMLKMADLKYSYKFCKVCISSICL
jgi:sorting nexin-25